MSEVANIAARFTEMSRAATRGVHGAGLVHFSSLLESARPIGPDLDLASDPIPTSTTTVRAAALAPAQPSSRVVSTGSLPERAARWEGEIAAAAERHGVDRELLTALVWTESAFRPDAVSPAGAIGLGQLMPGTAGDLGVDPWDPIQNLDGAARYLRQQRDRFGSDELALAAYNAGPGRVINSGGIPNISETQAYVRIVSARRDELKGIAG